MNVLGGQRREEVWPGIFYHVNVLGGQRSERSVLVVYIAVLNLYEAEHAPPPRIARIKSECVLLVSFPGSPAPEHEYAGRTWHLFSCEHDIIERGQNFQCRKVTFYTPYNLNAQCVGYSFLTS